MLSEGFSRARSIAAESKVRIAELEACIRIEKLKQRSMIAICDAIAIAQAPEREVLKPRGPVTKRHTLTEGDIANFLHDAKNDPEKARKSALLLVDQLLQIAKNPSAVKKAAADSKAEQDKIAAARETARAARVARELLERASLRTSSGPLNASFIAKKLSVECPDCPKRFFFALTHNERYAMGRCESCNQNWCIEHNNAEPKPAVIFVNKNWDRATKSKSV
mgnify:CR=1 FL=1